MSNAPPPDFTRLRPVRVKVRFPHDVRDVFAFVSDPTNDPAWVDTTPRVVQVDGIGPVVGAVYEYEQTVGRNVTGRITITDAAAPRWMAFRVEDPLRTSRIEYRLRSHKRGGCVLEQKSYAWYQSRKLRRWWMQPMVRVLVRRQLRKQMGMLRNALSG